MCRGVQYALFYGMLFSSYSPRTWTGYSGEWGLPHLYLADNGNQSTLPPLHYECLPCRGKIQIVLKEAVVKHSLTNQHYLWTWQSWATTWLSQTSRFVFWQSAWVHSGGPIPGGPGRRTQLSTPMSIWLQARLWDKSYVGFLCWWPLETDGWGVCVSLSIVYLYYQH